MEDDEVDDAYSDQSDSSSSYGGTDSFIDGFLESGSETGSSTSSDSSDDDVITSSQDSRNSGSTAASARSPANDNMNESPVVRHAAMRRDTRRRTRRLVDTESDPQTDDEFTLDSTVSSVHAESNPPSPTVSTFMIHENTDSVSGDDSDVTTMATTPTRSPSRASILSIPSEGENSREPRSPQQVDVLPPNSPADIPQVVDEAAAIPQQAPEPDAGNGETINNPEPPPPPLPPPQLTEPFLNNSCTSETDDNSLCSICMDPLTNSGNHRVVCLRCGHIFGQACLERWIKVGCNNGAKRCPTCNKKACLKDIRILYLPKVVPLDTVEKDRLIKEKEELIMQKNVIELELSKCKLQNQLSTNRYEERIALLERELTEARRLLKDFPKIPCKEDIKEKEDVTTAELLYSVDLCKEGGCRVLAYSPIQHKLVVSQPSGNTLFAGFGVRVLNSVDFQPSRYVFLHSKMIRDLAFHPEDRDMLLSVSLDHTAKLVDLASGATVHTFKGEGPLWSCSWDASNPHLMLVGSQLGRVCQYDRRMTNNYVNIWTTANNMTPVVSLVSMPSVVKTPFYQGGFLSCRLNGIYSYARRENLYESQELPLTGPFMSMRYDPDSRNLVTSARPSSSCPNVRISLNLVDVGHTGNVCLPTIHTFNCGSSARFLSRSTTVPTRNDSIVVAHHETGRTLNMWSSKTGTLLQSIPTREPIIDLANMSAKNSKCLFASLSEKKVCIYKVT